MNGHFFEIMLAVVAHVFNNMATVQFNHRMIAWLLILVPCSGGCAHKTKTRASA